MGVKRVHRREAGKGRKIHKGLVLRHGKRMAGSEGGGKEYPPE